MKQLLDHPRNKRIVYDEDAHTYEYFPDLRKKEGIKYNGVTGWIGSFSTKKFNAKKQAKSSNNNPNSQYYNWGEQAILDFGNRQDKMVTIYTKLLRTLLIWVYTTKNIVVISTRFGIL